MIDEKKIKEAADEYCAHLFSETIPRPHRQSWSGDTIIFKAGINWFLENLWHDASEEPDINKHILLIYDNKNPSAKNVIPYGYECLSENLTKDYWKYIVKIEHITRWLYIEDLMRGGK